VRQLQVHRNQDQQKIARSFLSARRSHSFPMGLPTVIQVDQGSEFVSRDLDLWAHQRGVTLDFSRPGTPTDNAFIEAFNGRFRVEWPVARSHASPLTAKQEPAT
jgi:putative transposase